MKNPAPSVSHSNRKIFLSSVGLVTLFTIIFWWPYLVGQKIFLHDNVPHLTAMHLAWDHLLRGTLPLWNPYMNGGEPLWTLIETVPFWDPIACLTYPIAKLFGLPSLYACHWSVYIWYLVFCWGALALARNISRNPWAIFGAFALLFSGSFFLSMPAQAHGFLVPFRYFPWQCLLLQQALYNNEKRSWLALAILCVVGMSGYQTGYSLFFLALFGVCLGGKKLFCRNSLFVSGVFCLGAAPSFVAAAKMMSLFPTSRLPPSGTYIFKFEKFILNFSDITFRSTDFYHGNAYIGPIAAAFALSAIATTVRRWKQMEPLRRSWLCLLIAAAFVVFGGLLPSYLTFGSFLGLRHWGFCETLILLSFAIFFVFGVEDFSKRDKSQDKVRGLWGLFCAGVFFLLLILLNAINYKRAAAGLTLMFLVIPTAIVIDQKIRSQKTKVALIVIAILLAIGDYGRLPSQDRFIKDVPKALKHVPQWSHQEPVFPSQRTEFIDSYAYIPFHFQLPAVHRIFTASSTVLELRVPEFLPFGAPPLIQQFQTMRYRRISTELSKEQKRKIYGVDTPLLRFSNTIEVIRGFDQFLETLKNNENNLWVDFIESTEPLEVDKDVQAKLATLDYSSSAIRIEAHADGRGVLIFSDGYDPQWKAWVNGKRAHVLAVNGNTKGIALVPGKHIVELKYRPWGYIVLFYLRWIFLIIGMAYLAMFALQQSRRS